MMYPFIFFFCALGLHICLYGIFISMTSNRIDIVPFGPELTAPKLLLHLWVKFEYLFGGDALYSLDDLAWTFRWNTLYQKVYMVFVRSNFNELNLIPNSTGLVRAVFSDCQVTVANAIIKATRIARAKIPQMDLSILQLGIYFITAIISLALFLFFSLILVSYKTPFLYI